MALKPLNLLLKGRKKRVTQLHGYLTMFPALAGISGRLILMAQGFIIHVQHLDPEFRLLAWPRDHPAAVIPTRVMFYTRITIPLTTPLTHSCLKVIFSSGRGVTVLIFHS